MKKMESLKSETVYQQTQRVYRLESDIARLSRENQRLEHELKQLKGRGIKPLLSEATEKFDQKVIRNIKKLNHKKTRHDHTPSTMNSDKATLHRKDLLLTVRMADIGAFYEVQGDSIAYKAAYVTYKILFTLFKLPFRILWRTWRAIKHNLNGGAK